MFLIESIDDNILADPDKTDYDKLLSHFAYNCTKDQDEEFMRKFLSVDNMEVNVTEGALESAKALMDKAKGLKIGEKAKAVVQLIAKAVSLNDKDIEETQSFRFKVLRMVISLVPFVAIGVMPIPTVAKLVNTIAVIIAGDTYSAVRRAKEINMLEANAEYLESKIEEAESPEKVKELRVIQKNMANHVAKLKVVQSKRDKKKNSTASEERY